MKHNQDLLASIVACVVLAMAGATTVFILIVGIPEQNETLVGQALGSLWTSLGMVVSYFFGTTRSSGKKDETIAALTKAKSEEA